MGKLAVSDFVELRRLQATAELMAIGGNRRMNAALLSSGHTVFYYVIDTGPNHEIFWMNAHDAIRRNGQWAVIHDHNSGRYELWTDNSKFGARDYDEVLEELALCAATDRPRPQPPSLWPQAPTSSRKGGRGWAIGGLLGAGAVALLAVLLTLSANVRTSATQTIDAGLVTTTIDLGTSTTSVTMTYETKSSTLADPLTTLTQETIARDTTVTRPPTTAATAKPVTSQAQTEVAPKPNLRPTAISAAAQSDGTILFDSGVENAGSGDAGGFHIRWLADGQDAGVTSLHAGIFAGATVLDQNSQFTWRFDTPGRHTVEFLVDTDDRVAESNEGDNTQRAAITV